MSVGKAQSVPVKLSSVDPVTRFNIRSESIYSGLCGVYMALAILAAPVVAVTSVGSNPLELTMLVAAFPVGVFFGPLWAGLGRRIGMQRLVTTMGILASIPLFVVAFIDESWQFTLLICLSQVCYSGMKMGQSSLYSLLYPKAICGQVLGLLTFWNFATMVPSILAAGWLLDASREMFRILYPLAGLFGLLACWFFHAMKIPDADRLSSRRRTIRDNLHRVNSILAEDRQYRLFQLAFFLSGSAFFMSTHVVLLLVSERMELSAFELTLWLTVVPQLVLAVSSPIWGRILDSAGIVRTRLFLALVQTTSLICYWTGIVGYRVELIALGSVFLGMTNGGGQLTWALASTHFAPATEDVPFYNGIHFVLNGVRGLLLPWVGSLLWVLLGPGAVLAAVVTSSSSIPIILRAMRHGDDGSPRVRGDRK